MMQTFIVCERSTIILKFLKVGNLYPICYRYLLQITQTLN